MLSLKLSSKQVKTISLLFFLGLLLSISLARYIWPGILLVIGLPLALRQLLLGRNFDTGVILFVFLGSFSTVVFTTFWENLLPILFSIGAIYLFFREFLENAKTEEDKN